MSENIYAKRNHEAQGAHYLRHIHRMTVEGLHSKSAIAGELAHRDAEIAALKAEMLDQRTNGNLTLVPANQLRAMQDEIAALKAIVAAYIVYDESHYEDDVQMMLDYANMLQASRAAMAQVVQPENQTEELK